MARLSMKGQIDEVIYTRLEPGEDLLRALWDIAEEHDIRAGVIMEGSGGLKNFRVQRYPHNAKTCLLPIDIVEYDGPLEANVHGNIGRMVIEPGAVKELPIPTIPGVLDTELDKWNMAGAQGGDGSPYVHAHMTASTRNDTIMGHLMTGTRIESLAQSYDIPSHFTVVIAKLKGFEFQYRMTETGFFHDYVAI